jgi:hypothetical protein
MEKFLEAFKGLFTPQRIQGLVVGIIATMVIGLYGFWTTNGNARAMATAAADAAVIEVLGPVCAAQAKEDPDIEAKLASLRAISTSFEQRRFITDAGWATFGEVTLTPRRLSETALLCRRILLEEEAA